MAELTSDIDENLELINTALLPPQARRLIKIIGLKQTVQLLKERGGTAIFIPESHNGSVLLEILSKEQVSKLCSSEMCGRHVDLPTMDKISIQLRNIRIKQKRVTGSSIPSLAKEYKLSRRWVATICKEVNVES